MDKSILRAAALPILSAGPAGDSTRESTGERNDAADPPQISSVTSLT